MKVINIKNIKWTNSNSELPTTGKFIVEDKFDITNIPIKLEKKYSNKIDEITYTNFHIPDTVEELLVSVNKTDKEKDIILPTGRFSAYGKRCIENLENIILDINKELKTSNELSSNLYDMVYLGYENITGHKLGKKTMQELMKPIKSALKE